MLINGIKISDDEIKAENYLKFYDKEHKLFNIDKNIAPEFEIHIKSNDESLYIFLEKRNNNLNDR